MWLWKINDRFAISASVQGVLYQTGTGDYEVNTIEKIKSVHTTIPRAISKVLADRIIAGELGAENDVTEMFASSLSCSGNIVQDRDGP